MSISDKKLTELIIRRKKPPMSDATRELVREYIQLQLTHRRSFWETEYNTMLDKDKFTNSEIVILSEFFERMKTLIKRDAQPGESQNTIQAQIGIAGGKLRLVIDVDASNFIK